MYLLEHLRFTVGQQMRVAEAKRVKLVIDISEDCTESMSALLDPLRMSQLIRCAVGCALKAVPAGGTITIRVDVDFTPTSNQQSNAVTSVSPAANR